MNGVSNELIGIGVSAILGLASGVGFFGGLYVTTLALATARRPGLLVAASFFGRIALVILLAWPAARLGAQWGLLAYLVGITASRLLIVGRVRSADETEEA